VVVESSADFILGGLFLTHFVQGSSLFFFFSRVTGFGPPLAVKAGLHFFLSGGLSPRSCGHSIVSQWLRCDVVVGPPRV